MIAIFLVAAGSLFTCATEIPLQGVEVDRLVENINGEPVVPRQANTLFLQIAENRTGIKGIPERLKIKISELLNIEGRLAVVPDHGRSDLRLDVIFSGYELQVLEYSDMGIPTKKRLRLLADIRLTDLNRDREIISGHQVQAFEEFSDTVFPLKSRMQVEESVIHELARRISLMTIQGWYTERFTEIERNK